MPGMILGTLRYMAPEQLEGKPVDGRTDLYALGLTLYEMVTGNVPFTDGSPLQEMYRRMNEAPKDPKLLKSDLPDYFANIILRCLETDPDRRFQSADDLVSDLENRCVDARLEIGAATSLSLPTGRPWRETFPWRWLGTVLAVLVLAVLGVLFRGEVFSGHGTTPSRPLVSLAILPFRNASADPSLDWLGSTIAEMLTTDVGQSSSLRTVSSGRLHEILRDLRITPDSTLDADALHRLAEFSNADQVIWGQYAKIGDHIRIDATLKDLKQQRTVSLKSEDSQ